MDHFQAVEKVEEALEACPEEHFPVFYEDLFKRIERARADKGFVWKEGKVVKRKSSGRPLKYPKVECPRCHKKVAATMVNKHPCLPGEEGAE